MRYLPLLSLAAVLGAPSITLAAQPTEATIRALEQAQARAAVAQDKATLERIFAPDYMMANPPGALVTRADLLELLGGATAPYLSAVYETQMVRDLGDVVLTSGVETVVPNTGGGARVTQQRRVTQVWKRAGGGWQLTFRHASLVAAP